MYSACFSLSSAFRLSGKLIALAVLYIAFFGPVLAQMGAACQIMYWCGACNDVRVDLSAQHIESVQDPSFNKKVGQGKLEEAGQERTHPGCFFADRTNKLPYVLRILGGYLHIFAYILQILPSGCAWELAFLSMYVAASSRSEML